MGVFADRATMLDPTVFKDSFLTADSLSNNHNWVNAKDDYFVTERIVNIDSTVDFVFIYNFIKADSYVVVVN